MIDVAIAGGGPAGLACAIHCARRGLRVVVLERSAAPPDKACGEGLMPRGLEELRRLGARVEGVPFRGIRYLQEDGSEAVARFRRGEEGLGVRRLELMRALHEAATGLERRAVEVTAFTQGPEGVRIGEVEAAVLVGADGLHSRVRRAAGLDGAKPMPYRFGLRRHYALAPWSDCVEVHWARGAEAYVTPVGARCVNVAFLFAGRGRERDLLARFPRLRARLGDAAPASEARGAGPLLQPVLARHRGRVALAGDAAGYLDAITGQGLSLAFASARLFAETLDLRDVPGSLRRYDAALGAKYLAYAAPARALLALARRPRLRSAAFAAMGHVPGLFPLLVRAVG